VKRKAEAEAEGGRNQYSVICIRWNRRK